MKIRPATQEDIDSLIRLLNQIGQLHHEHEPLVFTAPSGDHKAFWLKALEEEGRLFRVAVIQEQGKEKIAGLITARIDVNETIPFITRSPLCRIGTIVVDEACRQMGIGRALILDCEQWAQSHNAFQIRLEVMSFNASAKSFYDRLGYRPQSEIRAKNLLLT
ncbi:putative acetyltransferase [Vibrio aerogenes CECT 7868]|uniref:Putative acetyltransferase n=1 Tax=Vibrio aerogenes CECT 7868 TaxID=1216006 RepID=A0A1M6EC08_9VIBR|nr:N-acetyltransferase [Vibrio aerogenes]SHI82838.1 putative acetyltransferase [Vibrio aerogenes CECT 7868]